MDMQANVDDKTLLEWISQAPGLHDVDWSLQTNALQHLCNQILISTNEEVYHRFLFDEFVPALCSVMTQTICPIHVFELTVRALTYLMDIAVDYGQYFLNSKDALKVAFLSLNINNESSKTEIDCAEQCIKLLAQVSSHDYNGDMICNLEYLINLLANHWQLLHQDSINSAIHVIESLCKSKSCFLPIPDLRILFNSTNTVIVDRLINCLPYIHRRHSPLPNPFPARIMENPDLLLSIIRYLPGVSWTFILEAFSNSGRSLKDIRIAEVLLISLFECDRSPNTTFTDCVYDTAAQALQQDPHAEGQADIVKCLHHILGSRAKFPEGIDLIGLSHWRDFDGDGILAWACTFGSTKQVKCLLKAGYDPNNGVKAALCTGNIKHLKLLVEYGADLDALQDASLPSSSYLFGDRLKHNVKHLLTFSTPLWLTRERVRVENAFTAAESISASNLLKGLDVILSIEFKSIQSLRLLYRLCSHLSRDKDLRKKVAKMLPNVLERIARLVLNFLSIALHLDDEMMLLVLRCALCLIKFESDQLNTYIYRLGIVDKIHQWFSQALSPDECKPSLNGNFHLDIVESEREANSLLMRRKISPTIAWISPFFEHIYSNTNLYANYRMQWCMPATSTPLLRFGSWFIITTVKYLYMISDYIVLEFHNQEPQPANFVCMYNNLPHAVGLASHLDEFLYEDEDYYRPDDRGNQNRGSLNDPLYQEADYLDYLLSAARSPRDPRYNSINSVPFTNLDRCISFVNRYTFAVSAVYNSLNAAFERRNTNTPASLIPTRNTTSSAEEICNNLTEIISNNMQMNEMLDPIQPHQNVNSQMIQLNVSSVSNNSGAQNRSTVGAQPLAAPSSMSNYDYVALGEVAWKQIYECSHVIAAFGIWNIRIHPTNPGSHMAFIINGQNAQIIAINPDRPDHVYISFGNECHTLYTSYKLPSQCVQRLSELPVLHKNQNSRFITTSNIRFRHNWKFSPSHWRPDSVYIKSSNVVSSWSTFNETESNTSQSSSNQGRSDAVMTSKGFISSNNLKTLCARQYCLQYARQCLHSISPQLEFATSTINSNTNLLNQLHFTDSGFAYETSALEFLNAVNSDSFTGYEIICSKFTNLIAKNNLWDEICQFGHHQAIHKLIGIYIAELDQQLNSSGLLNPECFSFTPYLILRSTDRHLSLPMSLAYQSQVPLQPAPPYTDSSVFLNSMSYLTGYITLPMLYEHFDSSFMKAVETDSSELTNDKPIFVIPPNGAVLVDPCISIDQFINDIEAQYFIHWWLTPFENTLIGFHCIHNPPITFEPDASTPIGIIEWTATNADTSKWVDPTKIALMTVFTTNEYLERGGSGNTLHDNRARLTPVVDPIKYETFGIPSIFQIDITADSFPSDCAYSPDVTAQPRCPLFHIDTGLYIIPTGYKLSWDNEKDRPLRPIAWTLVLSEDLITFIHPGVAGIQELSDGIIFKLDALPLATNGCLPRIRYVQLRKTGPIEGDGGPKKYIFDLRHFELYGHVVGFVEQPARLANASDTLRLIDRHNRLAHAFYQVSSAYEQLLAVRAAVEANSGNQQANSSENLHSSRRLNYDQFYQSLAIPRQVVQQLSSFSPNQTNSNVLHDNEYLMNDDIDEFSENSNEIENGENELLITTEGLRSSNHAEGGSAVLVSEQPEQRSNHLNGIACGEPLHQLYSNGPEEERHDSINSDTDSSSSESDDEEQGAEGDSNTSDHSTSGSAFQTMFYTPAENPTTQQSQTVNNSDQYVHLPAANRFSCDEVAISIDDQQIGEMDEVSDNSIESVCQSSLIETTSIPNATANTTIGTNDLQYHQTNQNQGYARLNPVNHFEPERTSIRAPAIASSSIRTQQTFGRFDRNVFGANRNRPHNSHSMRRISRRSKALIPPYTPHMRNPVSNVDISLSHVEKQLNIQQLVRNCRSKILNHQEKHQSTPSSEPFHCQRCSKLVQYLLEFNADNPAVKRLRIPSSLNVRLARGMRKSITYSMLYLLSSISADQQNGLRSSNGNRIFRIRVKPLGSTCECRKDSVSSQAVYGERIENTSWCNEYPEILLKLIKLSRINQDGKLLPCLKTTTDACGEEGQGDGQLTCPFVWNRFVYIVNRLLLDPTIIATGSIPIWIDQLIKKLPFLIPFELRFRYFRATSFGTTRSLIWILENHPQSVDRSLAQSIGRLKKERCLIHRENILDDGCKLLNYHALHKAELEIGWIEEDGTGLGPTMEFYTVFSAELTRIDLCLWITDEQPYELLDGPNEIRNQYVHTNFGLFPAPYPVDFPSLPKVCEMFHTLGILIGKCLQDGRRCADLNLSLPLLKLLCMPIESRVLDETSFTSNWNAVLTAEDFEIIQPARARIFRSFQKIEHPLEDLNIPFSYFPSSSLYGFLECAIDDCYGITEIVTNENVDDYIHASYNFMFNTGIQSQMNSLIDGISEVMPVSSLNCFTPNELHGLICGDMSPTWTRQELIDNIEPKCGFNRQSQTYQYFIDTLIELNSEQRKGILQFITGCRTLPVGGIKALRPQITVAKKPDGGFPSVNTCNHFLKLPEFNSKNELMEKLLRSSAEHGFYFN